MSRKVTSPPASTPADLMRALHHDVRLHRPGGRVADPGEARSMAIHQPGMALVPLPPVTPNPNTWWDALARRVTVRRFAASPVDLQTVADVSAAARHPTGEGLVLPAEAAVGVVLIAWNTSDLPSGLYEYLADRHSLGALGPVPMDPEERTRLFLQREFAEAPAILMLVSDLMRASSSAVTYSRVLRAAGAKAQRMWMAAIARGLCGAPFAGLRQSAIRRGLGLSRFRAWPILALAIGHPIPADPANSES